MNFMNFIVVDEKIREGRNEYTVSGTVILKLDVPVPVIVKGKGCIGIGTVHQLLLTSDSTDITFTLSKVSKDACNAYYDLYRNQVSNSQSDDAYESSEDMVIPGAIGAKMQQRSNPDNYGNRQRRSNGHASLSDFYQGF